MIFVSKLHVCKKKRKYINLYVMLQSSCLHVALIRFSNCISLWIFPHRYIKWHFVSYLYFVKLISVNLNFTWFDFETVRMCVCVCLNHVSISLNPIRYCQAKQKEKLAINNGNLGGFSAPLKFSCVICCWQQRMTGTHDHDHTYEMKSFLSCLSDV